MIVLYFILEKNIPNKNRRISERLRSRNFSTSNSENSEASLDIPREAVLRRIRDENVQVIFIYKI